MIIFSKYATIYPPEWWCPSTMVKNKLKRIIAVPSFIKDSPMMTVVSLELAPALLRMDTTATGSVADTMDPKTKHSCHDQAGFTSIVKPAVSTVESTTPGTANTKHCQKVDRT